MVGIGGIRLVPFIGNNIPFVGNMVFCVNNSDVCLFVLYYYLLVFLCYVVKVFISFSFSFFS